MVTLETLHTEIEEIKSNVGQILEILEENELTGKAKIALEEARTTSDKEYVPHEEVSKL